MSLDVVGDLNWLAVIVAGIAFFALEAVWYAPPVFGRAWQRASGVEIPEGLATPFCGSLLTETVSERPRFWRIIRVRNPQAESASKGRQSSTE